MTSKEILAVIKGAFVSMNKDCEEQFNQIERDLEVLEILKELFSNNDYLTILLKTNYLYKIKDKTKLNLVKEWLVNEIYKN